MIDFDLSTMNFIRQDKESVKIKTRDMNVEYRLHKDDFRNPKDPEGDSITLWCIHVPQINQTYINETEEKVFEDLHEFFEEDFIRYMALKLLDERKKNEYK